ncbi:MAG: transcription repressor NadR [Clostridia bacterium]|nr:transcription repressor NadR [Clostridia bacterium]
MKGAERRMMILETLKTAGEPISGNSFAKQFGVSRQVIVQDIALLRAEGHDIVSTMNGYLLPELYKASRVFKVHHDNDGIEKELTMMVDLGGKVKDVFVSHKVYGLLRVDLNLNSRADVERYLESVSSGNSVPLLNLTSGFHYHTVLAENELILDAIQNKLEEYGFLAQLQDYEPVDFWKQSS